MANVNLTPDMITRESLRILHQKLQFVGNCVRDYDDSYAKEGAKIGDSLRIRLPYQYQTGTGATLNTTNTSSDSVGVSTTLQVNSRRFVPLRFTTEELTMDIDSFSSRHIEPAMTQLAAKVEADVIATAIAGASGWVNAGTKVERADVQAARKILTDNLAPYADRCALWNTDAMGDLVDANAALFNDQAQISKQYKEGMMGRFAGFDHLESTFMPPIVNAAGGDATYDVASNGQEKTLTATDSDPNNQTLAIDIGTKVIAKGAKFTIAGIYDVHPETKETTGSLKVFTVTGGDVGTATATSITISPAIIVSGPQKNCCGSATVSSTAADPSDGNAITFLGDATRNERSLLFQKGFCAFATADLYLPKGTDMASRQVHEGLSLRLVRDYTVKDDKLWTRIDILYGTKVLRPQLGVVVDND